MVWILAPSFQERERRKRRWNPESRIAMSTSGQRLARRKMKRFLTLSFPFPPSARRVPPEAWERLEKTGKPFHRESFYLTGTPFIVSWFLSLPSRETNNERIKFLSGSDSRPVFIRPVFLASWESSEGKRFLTSARTLPTPRKDHANRR